MANSLFDQLKKSGLVDEKKAKKARQSQYKNKAQKPKKGTAAPPDEAKLLAQKAHADKVERDRRLNREQKDRLERNAIAAQVRQLIESNRITERDGDIVYNFTDANIVKRICISEQIRQSLVSGRLAIVRLGTDYELVPGPVAAKIRQRDPGCIVFCEQDISPSQDEDDQYADYKIPDDLMW